MVASWCLLCPPLRIRPASKDGIQNGNKLLFSDDHHIFSDALDIILSENHSENNSLDWNISFGLAHGQLGDKLLWQEIGILRTRCYGVYWIKVLMQHLEYGDLMVGSRLLTHRTCLSGSLRGRLISLQS